MKIQEISSATQESFDMLMAVNQDTSVPSDVPSDDNQSSSSSTSSEPVEDNKVEKIVENNVAEVEECELTTLRMLMNTVDSTSDVEFVECCQEAQLLPATRACCLCANDPPMSLYEAPEEADGCLWKCDVCGSESGLRDGTWVEDCDGVRLKDIILSLYGWTRGWSETICQLEGGVEDLTVVQWIYDKCRNLVAEYFTDEICNIGGPNAAVDIDVFKTKSGLTVVCGLERKHDENLFFRIMPENYTRDDVVTALIDNIHSGSLLYCKESTQTVITLEGMKFLRKNWDLKVLKLDKDYKPIQWKQMWWLYMKTVLLEDVRSAPLLHEHLFRRRMNANRDGFLFLISIISDLHPPPT